MTYQDNNQLATSARKDDRSRRWRPGAAVSLAFALCVMATVLSAHSAALFAQPPGTELPAVSNDRTEATSTAAPSLPSDLDFDIDLDTEEFEGFGEESFQVEEASYFRDTILPIAIRVSIGAVVILLLAWVAMKLVKPKPPTSID